MKSIIRKAAAARGNAFATIRSGVQYVGDCDRGDRVRMADGRILELAWPTWGHGTDKSQQSKERPWSWFVREIVDDFGAEVRSDPFDIDSDEPIAERVYEFGNGIGDDDGKRGGDVDPLAVRSSDGTQGVLGV